ncbi:MAG: DUF1275 family protein [Solirubrobacteraceae bacterium]
MSKGSETTESSRRIKETIAHDNLPAAVATHPSAGRHNQEQALAATAAIATAAIVLGPSGGVRFGVIAPLGIATGLQNATVRRLGIPDLTTTVLTLTLTGLHHHRLPCLRRTFGNRGASPAHGPPPDCAVC